MKVIKNPIESHLPVGCRKIGTSFSAEKHVDIKNYVPELPQVSARPTRGAYFFLFLVNNSRVSTSAQYACWVHTAV